MNWKTAYLETRVMSASPLELTAILYEYAVMRVQEAREHLRAGDIPARSVSISKAIAIVSELQGALDMDSGGEIAQNLSNLYVYIQGRLLQANAEQSPAILSEVETLLSTLLEAWQSISTGAAPAATPAFGGATAWAPIPVLEGLSGAGAHSWSA
jgi:flagellar protein FliS